MLEQFVPHLTVAQSLYRAEQVRRLDQVLIEEIGIPGGVLMQRAGSASFQQIRRRWPDIGRITVVCGTGNNGGDGFVVARLAIESGIQVQLLLIGDQVKLSGDALACAQSFKSAGGSIQVNQAIDPATDLVVDAIFGTGLEREVEGEWRRTIEAINAHAAPKVALDIPSGLHADSGAVLGVAVEATLTVSFIGLKQGLFTGEGPQCSGILVFNDLGAPSELYRDEPPSAWLNEWAQLAPSLQPRNRNAHKGSYGHLLLVGGEVGYSGAITLAAQAALRAGAGLVSVATRQQHVGGLAAAQAEIMAHPVEQTDSLKALKRRASVLAIGPGLGQQPWGVSLLGTLLESDKPMVVDADALNLLALEPLRKDNWILTPHPGEAARLLDCSTADIQRNRFDAVGELQSRYGGVAVLKGAGTLICGPSRNIVLCRNGNPGMASGGMGDLLTGVIGALLAQKADLETAAVMGCCLHGAAADRAAADGERGMLASDLLPFIRQLLNPGGATC